MINDNFAILIIKPYERYICFDCYIDSIKNLFYSNGYDDNYINDLINKIIDKTDYNILKKKICSKCNREELSIPIYISLKSCYVFSKDNFDQENLN